MTTLAFAPGGVLRCGVESSRSGASVRRSIVTSGKRAVASSVLGLSLLVGWGIPIQPTFAEQPIVDNGNALTSGEEKRLNTELEQFEKDVG